MKSFFKSVFASCLGIVIAFAAIFLIILIFAATSMSTSTSYSDNSILKLSLEEIVPEKTDNVVQSSSMFSNKVEALGLRRILKLIDAAAKDDKIKGILIENGSTSVGQATLLSLTEGLKKFKESGKFIYSYADYHSQSSYMLCSVADSMFLNPQGGVDLKGFAVAIPFFKNTLDKIGVGMNIFYAGNFKSATEPYRLNEMSEYNRIQTRAFLDDMKDIMIDVISANRPLSREKIDNIMNELGGRTAEKSLENGLVDVIFYKDEMEDFLKEKLGVKKDKKLKTISLSKYNTLADIKEESKGKDKIAIVYAEGEIAYGGNEPGVISDERYMKMLRKIRNDDNIKAVVLRVNSPGGSAFASEMIWRELEQIKAAGKPVIASFGDYAASGGYYISSGADVIVSEPNTLTGSIGVFSILPDATKLFNDKLGINFDTVKTNDLAVGFSPFLPLSDKERALLQESTLDIYDLFLERVSKGRNLPLDSTKVIAQGRVWTGRAAQKIGLVDKLGSLEDAIGIAAEKAGMDAYKIVEYPFVKEDFFTSIIKGIIQGQNGDDDEGVLLNVANDKNAQKWLEMARQAQSIIKMKEPQARMPFIVEWN